MILEGRVTLLCGNTLCRQHLDEFETIFKCPFCHEQHSIPDDGYFINEDIGQKIDSFYQSDSLRKEAKESLTKLNDIIYDYEKIDPDCYIFDYIGGIVNRVDLHRDEMIEEVIQKSKEMKKQLKEKEQKCKSNLINLVKMKIEPDDLAISTSKNKEQNDLLANLNEQLNLVQNETKKYENKLLMNEAIHFEKYEKSSSFGKLSFYSNKTNVLSDNCGQLIKIIQLNYDCILSVQVDVKSNKLITVSFHGEIKVFNLETGECLKTFKDHEHSVDNILLIPDNKFISRSSNNILKIWDLNSYECLHAKQITRNNRYGHICLISDNQIAYSCNGKIHILDLNSLNTLKSFKAHADQIKHLLLVDKTKLMSCSDKKEKKIKIWDLKTFKKIKEINIDSNLSSISYLKPLSDRILLSCCYYKNIINLWQIETGQMIKSIELEFSVHSAKLLNDELIALAQRTTREGLIIIYNFIKMEKIIIMSAHESDIDKLCLISNGNLVSLSDSQIKYWKMLDGDLERVKVSSVKSDQSTNEIEESIIKLNQLIKDYENIDPELYVINYIEIYLNRVNCHQEELLKEINEKSDEIIKQLKAIEEECKLNALQLEKVSFRQLKSNILPLWKNSLRKRDLNQEELNDILLRINDNIGLVKNLIKKHKSDLLMNKAIYFDKKEKSSLFGKLYVYSGKTHVLSDNFGDLIYRGERLNHDLNKSVMEFDENNNKMITSSNNKTIDISNYRTAVFLKRLDGHQNVVTSILVISNSRLVSASRDKTIKIWNLNSYECLNTLTNESGVSSLCLITDNELACGSEDGSINIWDLNNSNKIKTFREHYNKINNLILADKTKLISCSNENIKILNLETFECIELVKGYSRVINHLELTADGNLLSCSDDQTVKLWQTETGQLLNSIKFDDVVKCIKSLNEELISFSLKNGQIHIYNINKMETLKIISAHESECYRLYLFKNGVLLSESIYGEIKLWQIFDE